MTEVEQVGLCANGDSPSRLPGHVVGGEPPEAMDIGVGGEQRKRMQHHRYGNWTCGIADGRVAAMEEWPAPPKAPGGPGAGVAAAVVAWFPGPGEACPNSR